MGKSTLTERLAGHHDRLNDLYLIASKAFGRNNPMVSALEHELQIIIHIKGCIKENTYTHPEPRN